MPHTTATEVRSFVAGLQRQLDRGQPLDGREVIDGSSRISSPAARVLVLDAFVRENGAILNDNARWLIGQAIATLRASAGATPGATLPGGAPPSPLNVQVAALLSGDVLGLRAPERELTGPPVDLGSYGEFGVALGTAYAERAIVSPDDARRALARLTSMKPADRAELVGRMLDAISAEAPVHGVRTASIFSHAALSILERFVESGGHFR